MVPIDSLLPGGYAAFQAVFVLPVWMLQDIPTVRMKRNFGMWECVPCTGWLGKTVAWRA